MLHHKLFEDQKIQSVLSTTLQNVIGSQKMNLLLKYYLLFFIFLPFYGETASVTQSGGNCNHTEEQKPPDYDVVSHAQNAYDASFSLLEYLKTHAQRSAIVARAGSDMSKENFNSPHKYTHVGIAWKSSEDGLWRFQHVLNVCAGPTSTLFVQNLVQFFDDGPHFYDFKIGIPSSELQEKIADVLESHLVNILHNPWYSNIANPFQNQYQNSNGWVLNMIASAQSGLQNIADVQNYLHQNNYTPSQVRVGWLRGKLSAFSANATTRDHTKEEKRKRWYRFVSAKSIFDYLEQTDPLAITDEICHQEGCNIPFSQLNSLSSVK